MAAIPDMLIIDKRFRFLATRGAHLPYREVRLGDPTCDPDGRYPPEAFDNEVVLLPDTTGPQQVVALGVGAYQEILAGVRGAHHCGLLEAIELIIEPDPKGGTTARIMPRQTWRDAAAVLGYTDAASEMLRSAMRGGELNQ
jgi:arginine decarboxylase-like protein